MKYQDTVAFIGIDSESFMMLSIGLEGLLFEDRPIKLYNISFDEYKEELKKHRFALIIIDAVKEWKKIIKYLRETLDDQDSRIILRSLSKDSTPDFTLLQKYDIQDIRYKGDLTPTSLGINILSALRTHKMLAEKKRYEEELTRKKRELEDERNIFINGPVVIFRWLYKKGFEVEYVSSNIKEMLGFSDEEFIKKETAFKDIVFKHDFELVKNSLEDALKNNYPYFELEYRVLKKNGNPIWIYQFFNISKKGGKKVVTGYMLDITNKKESELIFFERATEGIVILDRENKISRCNRAFLDMVKKDEKGVIGRLFIDLLGRDCSEIFEKSSQEVTLKAKNIKYELKICSKDKDIPSLINHAPLFDINGKIEGSFCFIIDLEEQKRLQLRLLKAMEAEKRFIATISHEIRTPITSILGFLELLKDSDLRDAQKDLLQNVNVSSQHLLSLINGILDASKIEAGQLELAKEEINLHEILSECLIIISGKIKKGVELQFKMKELEHYLVGDRLRIKQIFVNLLSNAAKFTHKGFIKLELLKTEKKDSSYHIEISVEDSGVGIAKERVENLFKPFKQAHSSEYGGTGLGLYLSKSFATLMGGDIRVESIEGEGSRFIVSLKLAIGSFKESMFSLKGRHILLFVKERFLETQLQDKLLKIGATVFNVSRSTSVEKIVAKSLKQKTIHCAILDMDYLGKKSVYIAGILKSLFEKIYIVGIKSEQNLLSFEEIDEEFVKPFRFFELSSQIYKVTHAEEKKEDMDYSYLKVLVAEDVELNKILSIKLFKKFFDIDIDVAGDGLEALKAAKEKKYDIIFMDINMPHMDGIESTVKIREFDKETPIVALSANAYAEDLQKAFDAGMNGYVTKPFEEQKLRDAIKRCTEKRSGKFCISNGLIEENKIMNENIYTQKIRKLLEAEFDKDVIDEILKEFKIQIKNYLISIKSAQKTKNFEEIGNIAHSIKGMLLNLKLEEEAMIAKEIEGRIKKGKKIEDDDLSKIVSFLQELEGAI